MLTAVPIMLKRAHSQLPILLAAFITILLATTLLAAGPIYANAVYVAGAQRTLRDAPPAEAGIEIVTGARAERYASVDALVTESLGRALAGIGGSIARSGTSESYALPGQDDVTDLAVFRFSEGIEEHATLVSGSWPRPADGPLETAIADVTAELLGLTTGDRVVLENRLDDSLVEVEIAGVYSIDRAGDPYWYDDPLMSDGVLPGASFTTYGPFLVAREAFLRHLTTRPAEMTWRYFPDVERVTIQNLAELRGGAQGLAGQLNARRDGGDEIEVRTRLPRIVSGIERSLLATRSGVLILTIQLALLAGYALVLTAGLLVDQRAMETALLRSRGANVRQIVGVELLEGLLLVAPAVALGPWLAALSLRLLNRAGPLASIGLTLQPQVTRTALLLSVVAGLICLAALVLPALFSARSVLEASAARGRQRSGGLWRRGRLDLALLLLAVIGFVQLRRYGSPITETVQGRLEIDPLLVAAPALGLLAGAIMALRLIPWLARRVEAFARRGMRLVPALGAWQIARRPLRYTRAALLLILAVGIGLFAVAYTSTWETSQDDQADYQVGADVTLQPNQRADAVSGLHLASAHLGLDGVHESMPIAIHSHELSSAVGSADVILLDSDQAASVVNFRPDLADDAFPALMQRLTSARPSVTGIPLPGEPRRLALDMRATVQQPCQAASLPEGSLPSDSLGPSAPSREAPAAQPGDDNENCIVIQGDPGTLALYRAALTPVVVLRDADGSYHRIRLDPLVTIDQERGGPLRSIDRPERYSLPLTRTLDDGTLLTPRYPLELVALEIDTLAPSGGSRSGSLELHAIAVSDVAEGDAWTDVTPASSDWVTAGSSPPASAGVSPSIAQVPSEGDELVAVTFDTGASNALTGLPVTLSIRPAGSETRSTLPVIVSEQLIAAAAFRIGDTFAADIGGGERALEIVGAVRAFPTIAPEQPAIIIADLETLAALQLNQPGVVPVDPDTRWLAVDAGNAAAVADALERQPFSSSRVASRQLRAQALRTDPVTLGAIGALSIGFLAAAVFAVIGFIVSASVSARERLREFALLRALGLSPRQLAGWLLLENGFLVVTSLVGGTLLGLLLAWLVLPLIAITQEATQVFPRVVIVIPWGTFSLLQAALIAALVVLSGILVLALQRRGLGTALRIGEH